MLIAFYYKLIDIIIISMTTSSLIYQDKINYQGIISNWLKKNSLPNEFLGFDHQGVEILKIEPENLLSISLALHSYGFNYLRCQSAYDDAPGGQLVSVYHLVRLSDNADEPEELCMKVFVSRIEPVVPSVYWIWKTADFQERESYDMYGILYEGHPCLKRILMPEDWVGWPLRKDYITPNFYELQSAY